MTKKQSYWQRRNFPKPRKGAWFIPLRWSYLPASWQGWLTYVPFLAYLIFTFVVIAKNTTHLWTLPLSIFPYWICGAVVMHWIARHKS